MSWLIKRGVTYYIGYREGTKDRYLSTKKQDETAAETERLKFDLAQRQQTGEAPLATPEMSIDAVIELYKKDTDLKEKTTNLNDYSWQKFKLESALTRIGEVTTEAISGFRDDMLEDDYAKATVSIWLRDVKKLFKFAKDSGIINKDPANPVELPDEDIVFRFLTPDEEAAILTHASPILNRVATAGFETGLRITQLVEMDWKHYRPTDHIYYVEKQKRQKARYIPISPRALAVMGPVRLSGRVFPDATRTQISHMWTRAKDHAGIKGRARFHDIRHTYVSRVCKVLNATEVRDLMGWCSVEMVDRYTHSRVSDIQAKLNQGTSVLALVAPSPVSAPD